MSIVWKPLRAEQQRGNPVKMWYFAYHTNYKWGDGASITPVDRPVVGRKGRYPDSDLPRWWRCV